MIVERILSTIERTIDNVPHYFDPATTPEELLPWLAGWVGLELDQNAPLIKRRRALSRAAGLYRWQGTRRALREQLAEYTGQRPLIVENFDGLRLGNDAMLGVNTVLGQACPHSMTITALTDDVQEVDEGVVRRIVEGEKPVHVGYSLEIRQHVPPVRATSPLTGDPLLSGPSPDSYTASEVVQ
jgi:phage tail-like protein